MREAGVETDVEKTATAPYWLSIKLYQGEGYFTYPWLFEEDLSQYH